MQRDNTETIVRPHWKTRVDLAACYRLVAHYRMTDLVYTHISARIPGEGHHFLVNRYGQMFHEVKASDLVEVDVHGRALEEKSPLINVAGFFIHGAVHEARADAACVIHVHTTASIAVSAQEEGLLPLSQHAMKFHGRVSYHDYTGVVTDDAERRRLAEDLGMNDVMLLRNHGMLVTGCNVAEAFVNLHYLERACQIQIAAQAGGGKLRHIDEKVAQDTTDWLRNNTERRRQEGALHAIEWTALTRMLDEIDPSYKQ